MKLLILIISFLLCGVGYNLYNNEFIEAIVFSGVAILLILVMLLFRREDKRQLALLGWLINEKANIYKGQVTEEGVAILPTTRLIQYDAVVSFAFLNYVHSSRLYIKNSRSSRIYGLLYSLITILFGWWSLPWGPILTIKILIFNLLGRSSISVHDIIQFGGEPPKWKKQPKLIREIIKANTTKVSNLLYQGTDPNTRDQENRTALMRAAEFADVEMVRLLLDHGADPNLLDDGGETVLHRAAVNGKSDVVAFLLDYQQDPNTTNHYGDTPLMMASNRGYTNVMQVLITRGALLDLQNQQGVSALMLAVDGVELASVRLLLDNGADRELVNIWNTTAEKMAEEEELSSIMQLFA